MTLWPCLRSSLSPKLLVNSARLFHTTRWNSVKDYYGVLGVAKNSNQKDIKKAYYQLAKKYHPDTNKDDPTAMKKFQEVSEAYEVLSDDDKRAAYCSDKTSGEKPAQPAPSPPSSQYRTSSTTDAYNTFNKANF